MSQCRRSRTKSTFDKFLSISPYGNFHNGVPWTDYAIDRRLLRPDRQSVAKIEPIANTNNAREAIEFLAVAAAAADHLNRASARPSAETPSFCVMQSTTIRGARRRRSEILISPRRAADRPSIYERQPAPIRHWSIANAYLYCGATKFVLRAINF